MKDFVILADSTCDLSDEARKDINMIDYVKGHVNYNGIEFPTTLDWSHFSMQDYYEDLSNKKMKISTAPASPAEYFEYFEKYVKEDIGVISISLSSKISSTHRFTELAAGEIKEKYPEAKIYCLDSYRMSGGIGLLTYYAHMLKNQGKTYEEVVSWLEENKTKVHQMGPIDDLIFVARRGRISMGKAILGNFAGVKPMGDCSPDGYTSVLTKVKGMGKALDLTTKYIDATATNIEDQYLFIVHSNRELYANALKDKLAALNPKKIYVSDVYSACGANVGPGMIGVYYLGDQISENNEKEKNIMNSLTNK